MRPARLPKTGWKPSGPKTASQMSCCPPLRPWVPLTSSKLNHADRRWAVEAHVTVTDALRSGDRLSAE